MGSCAGSKRTEMTHPVPTKAFLLAEPRHSHAFLAQVDLKANSLTFRASIQAFKYSSAMAGWHF